MDETPVPARPTQSVARAISLLRCFADADASLTLSELARRTSMTPSTALRLLRTLCAEGILARREGTEQYVLGPTMEQLAHRVYAGRARAHLAPVLDGLASQTHESISFGRRDGRFVVVLMRSASDQALRFERPEGTRVPLHASAMGKALLAFGAAPIASAVRDLRPLERVTPATVTGVRRLVLDLEAARDRGFAIVDEEQHVGVRSVAAPVLGDDGVARAAVAAQGPVSRLTDKRIVDLGQMLVAAAAEIARLPVLPDEPPIAP